MQATITDFLTLPEIDRAATMFREQKPQFAQRVCEEIIRPNIARINTALHQENDPMYLAYAVEYVMTAWQG